LYVIDLALHLFEAVCLPGLLSRDNGSASKKMFSCVIAPCVQVSTCDGIHYARNAVICQPQLIDGNSTLSA